MAENSQTSSGPPSPVVPRAEVLRVSSLVRQELRELAERRASMKAWVQYSRALFSAAEFRFIS